MMGRCATVENENICWNTYMKYSMFIAIVGTASIVASADAGVLGYAAFSYTASNGNVVVDVFTVVSNASDRLLNIYNVNLTTTQGGSTLATYAKAE